MYIKDNTKSKIKLCVACVIIACVIAFAIFTVMKYEVEGEKVVPFKIGKVIVISSAITSNDDVDDVKNNDNLNKDEQQQGQQNEEQQPQKEQVQEQENYIWNEKVVQTNDVYIYLDKNKDYNKDEIIKKVKIENIKILQNVKIGKIQVYMPSSLDGSLYKYSNDFLINSGLTYNGGSIDNPKTLEICNQGGGIFLSFANLGLGNYKSNEDEEIVQGGTILEKMSVSNDDLKFKVSFDLIIEVQDKSYKTTLELDLPIDNLVGQKETHNEITDFSNVIFKRM